MVVLLGVLEVIPAYLVAVWSIINIREQGGGGGGTGGEGGGGSI